MISQADALGFTMALALLNWNLGALLSGGPFTYEIRRRGERLRVWAVYSVVPVLAYPLFKGLTETVGRILLGQNNPSIAILAIEGILGGITGILTAVVVGVKAGTLTLFPADQILGPAITTCVNAMVFWMVIHYVIDHIALIFLFFLVGAVVYALPMEIGKRAGGVIMAFAISASVLVPLTPILALNLAAYIGLQKSSLPSVLQIVANPADLSSNIAAGIWIAFIIFPTVWFGFIGMITMGISDIVGGLASSFVDLTQITHIQAIRRLPDIERPSEREVPEVPEY